MSRNILASGFTGTVNAVNPKHDTVLGIHTVASAHDLPVAPDLVVVAVPAASVLDVVHECGECGARGIVLLSSGFGETGAAGEAMQRRAGRGCPPARHAPGRPELPRHAQHRPGGPAQRDIRAGAVPPGRRSAWPRSPAPSASPCSHAATRCGLGISEFVSLGNKADVSGNDLLPAWYDDPRTSVIALYLESFGNPRKFARIARAGLPATSRSSPSRAGRSAAGQRAGASHTAAAASPDAVVDALFAQAGVAPGRHAWASCSTPRGC